MPNAFVKLNCAAIPTGLLESEVDQAKRLKELEQENLKLKRLVAKRALAEPH